MPCITTKLYKTTIVATDTIMLCITTYHSYAVHRSQCNQCSHSPNCTWRKDGQSCSPNPAREAPACTTINVRNSTTAFSLVSFPGLPITSLLYTAFRHSVLDNFLYPSEVSKKRSAFVAKESDKSPWIEQFERSLNLACATCLRQPGLGNLA